MYINSLNTIFYLTNYCFNMFKEMIFIVGFGEISWNFKILVCILSNKKIGVKFESMRIILNYFKFKSIYEKYHQFKEYFLNKTRRFPSKK